jgi:ATP-dependent protease ClpP protease subunit
MPKMMNPMLKKYTNEDADDEDSETSDEQITVDKNKVMFYSDVDNNSCLKLIQCFNKAKEYVAIQNVTNEFDDPMKVYIHICSDGGEIFSSLSVIDTILNSKVDVVTVCEGCVASAGVLISLSGKERYIRKHAYMLIHEIRSGCIGKYSECQDDMKNNDIIMNDMKTYMNERCNNKLLKKKLNKVLKHDIIWDANKCLKYGLIDKIV